MPAGRPPYVLPDGWKETLLDLGRKGKSKLHMSVALGMSRTHFQDLEKENSEFMVAVKEACDLSQLWWEDAGQLGMYVGDKENAVNPAIYNFRMSALFGWSAKTESKNDHTTNGKDFTTIECVIVKAKN
jgi:hypothetical protein